MYFRYNLGITTILVDVKNVEYDPPQDPYSAASDWDCYGNLEIEWEIVSVEGGEDSIDEEYVEYLLRKDIMDRINNRDEDY